MAIQKVEQNSWLLQQFEENHLNTSYKIDKNAPLKFKIINSSVLTSSLRSLIKQDRNLIRNFNIISDLEEKKLWLKTKDHIIPMNMLDIYNAFSSNLKDTSFDDQLFNCANISFCSPTGPFKEVPLIHYIEDNILATYLMYMNLKSSVPARNLRIESDSKLFVSFGQNFLRRSHFNLKQITDSGLLFSCKDNTLVDEIAKSKKLRFHMNTKNLIHFTENNFSMNQPIENFFETTRDGDYFEIDQDKLKISLSYKSEFDNQFYFYCRYKDIENDSVRDGLCFFTEQVNAYLKTLV